MSEQTPLGRVVRRFTCPGLSMEQPDSIVACYRAGHECRSTWEELRDEYGVHQRSFCGCCGEQYSSTGASHELLAEWQAAQPDRPEQVDPASVRVGDVVTVEADDGSWTVRGEIDNVDPGSSYPFRVLVPHMHAGGIWPRLGPSSIRVLHHAEPEPDEAAVEALADGLVDQYQTIQNGKWRDAARTLIRDHGVEVRTDE